jgi:DNA-binding GntR family transcriptional regulator
MSVMGNARRLPSSSSIADNTADILRNEILEGVLAPGEAVTEPVLAERLGVSRTPIREAVTQLEAEGLMVRRNRRLIVVELSAQEAADVYETRIPLECLAARKAAETASAACATDLGRILAMSRHEADQGDWKAVDRAARAFHNTIFSHCGNPVLERTLRQLHDRADHYRLFRHPGAERRLANSLTEHVELAEAIKKGDGAQAADLMYTHITRARDNLMKRFVEAESTKDAALA